MISPKKIDSITVQVAIEEVYNDELTITEHPVAGAVDVDLRRLVQLDLRRAAARRRLRGQRGRRLVCRARVAQRRFHLGRRDARAVVVLTGVVAAAGVGVRNARPLARRRAQRAAQIVATPFDVVGDRAPLVAHQVLLEDSILQLAVEHLVAVQLQRSRRLGERTADELIAARRVELPRALRGHDLRERHAFEIFSAGAVTAARAAVDAVVVALAARDQLAERGVGEPRHCAGQTA
ncbi:hypothetical protein [Burkholderia ubonensis]|uniref:hypothetical protein n=1 Tax=Burkholderia ubonensis TaxID=101571 RepID=UPI000A860F22|nr:hypothetical protein [Burkholderia ubonensis]